MSSVATSQDYDFPDVAVTLSQLQALAESEVKASGNASPDVLEAIVTLKDPSFGSETAPPEDPSVGDGNAIEGVPSYKKILSFYQAIAKAQEHSIGSASAYVKSMIATCADPDVAWHGQDDSGPGDEPTIMPARDLPEYIFIQSDSAPYAYLSHWGKGLTMDREEPIGDCAWKVEVVDNSSFKLVDNRGSSIDSFVGIMSDSFPPAMGHLFGSWVDKKDGAAFKCYRLGKDNFHGFVIVDSAAPEGRNALTNVTRLNGVWGWDRKVRLAESTRSPNAVMRISPAAAVGEGNIKMTGIRYEDEKPGIGKPWKKTSVVHLTNGANASTKLARKVELKFNTTREIGESNAWSNQLEVGASIPIPKVGGTVDVKHTSTTSRGTSKSTSTTIEHTLSDEVEVNCPANSKCTVTMVATVSPIVIPYTCFETVKWIMGGTNGKREVKGELKDEKIEVTVEVSKFVPL